MKNYVFDNLYIFKTPEDVNKNFCKKICEYINNNVEIKYLWSANLPYTPFTPDPDTSYITKSIGTGIIELTKINFFPAALDRWCTEISIMLRSNLQIPAADGWQLPIHKYNQNAIIKIVFNKENNFESSTLEFCKQFINKFKISFLNQQTISGTHGQFVGISQMIEIK